MQQFNQDFTRYILHETRYMRFKRMVLDTLGTIALVGVLLVLALMYFDIFTQ